MLLGATTQGASHSLLPEQMQQYWYHRDLGCCAACIAGCWPVQALWWDHTSWLWSRGYHCQGLLCITCPQSGSSQLCSAACVGPGLLVPLCEGCDGQGTSWRHLLSDGIFVPWALLAAEEAQGYLLRCTQAASQIHIPLVPPLRSHWTWGSHLVFPSSSNIFCT